MSSPFPPAFSLPAPADPAAKAALRARMRALRASLAADTLRHAALSEALQRHLLASAVWRESPVVMLYCAVRGEVDTTLLLAGAWAEGKRVLLPRCRPGERGVMDAVTCSGPDGLVRSGLGIPEPAGEPAPPGAAREALIVTPGLAFDREGYRLGYGGGYYDRLFEAGAGHAVGLVFLEHLVDRVPRDPWDKPVNALCTEEGLLWIPDFSPFASPA